MWRWMLLGVFLALPALGLSACNTARGIGKDTKETTDFVTGTPANDAYHQDARDF